MTRVEGNDVKPWQNAKTQGPIPPGKRPSSVLWLFPFHCTFQLCRLSSLGIYRSRVCKHCRRDSFASPYQQKYVDPKPPPLGLLSPGKARVVLAFGASIVIHTSIRTKSLQRPQLSFPKRLLDQNQMVEVDPIRTRLPSGEKYQLLPFLDVTQTLLLQNRKSPCIHQ